MSYFLQNYNYWRWITIFASFLWLIAFYGNVLLYPDDYMFSAWGDGIKNYFTFAWHVRYDTNWLVFEGSNYPYHEHVGFTDGHPLFSFFVRWVPYIKNHPVGFLNLFMLLSMVLTSWSLFELLRRLHVEPWIACIGALCINWMNPQLFRLNGHYALSYAWVIPTALLLIHYFFLSRRWKFALLYFIYSSLIWFIHPYLGMALALIAFAFLFFDAFVKLIKKNFEWKHALQWLLMGMVPVLTYLCFVKLTDTHTERTDFAYGYLYYSASYESLFVPNHKPFRHLISQVIKVRHQTWEGWSYIGLGTMLMVLFTLIFFYKKLISIFRQSEFWLVALFAVTSITLLACGFPFKQGNKEWLKSIPYIEQFRSPGRFAWVMYYSVTAFAFMLLSYWIKSWIHGRLWLKITVALLLVGLFIVEGKESQFEVSGLITQNANYFKENYIRPKAQEHIDKLKNESVDSLALFPIPFFHYGSDLYSIPGNENENSLAYEVAYHTGIPLMASSNPRVSHLECRNMLNLFNNGLTENPLWSEIPNDHPIYIMRLNTPLFAGDSIFHFMKGDYFRMSELRNKFEEYKTSIASDSTVINEKYFTAEYDTCANGRLATSTVPYTTLYEINGDSLAAHSRWNASVWLYYEDVRALTTTFHVEKKLENGVDWLATAPAGKSHFLYRDSCLLELSFNAEPGINYRFYSKGGNDDDSKIFLDHFLLRPSGVNVKSETFVNEDRIIRCNNLPFFFNK